MPDVQAEQDQLQHGRGTWRAAAADPAPLGVWACQGRASPPATRACHQAASCLPSALWLQAVDDLATNSHFDVALNVCLKLGTFGKVTTDACLPLPTAHHTPCMCAAFCLPTRLV